MKSLVLELQRDALNSGVRVSDLLRKTVAVATKLRQDELRAWAQRELTLYMDGSGCPPYRVVEGQLQALNPALGRLIPVVVNEPETARVLSRRESGQAIGQIEELISKKTGVLQMSLPPHVLKQVFGDTMEYNMGIIPTLIVDRAALAGILDSVRNVVLDWSLRLEQEGVLGEGLTFSGEEIARATHVTYNIGSFQGILGDVNGSTVSVGNYNAVRQELIAKGIPTEQRAELEEILDRAPIAPPEERKALAARGMAWLARNAVALGALSDTIRGWFEALGK